MLGFVPVVFQKQYLQINYCLLLGLWQQLSALATFRSNCNCRRRYEAAVLLTQEFVRSQNRQKVVRY